MHTIKNIFCLAVLVFGLAGKALCCCLFSENIVGLVNSFNIQKEDLKPVKVSHIQVRGKRISTETVSIQLFDDISSVDFPTVLSLVFAENTNPLSIRKMMFLNPSNTVVLSAPLIKTFEEIVCLYDFLVADDCIVQVLYACIYKEGLNVISREQIHDFLDYKLAEALEKNRTLHCLIINERSFVGKEACRKYAADIKSKNRINP